MSLAEYAGTDGDERNGRAKRKGQRQADHDPCSRKPDDDSFLQGASWWTQESNRDHKADKERQPGNDLAASQKPIHCLLPSREGT